MSRSEKTRCSAFNISSIPQLTISLNNITYIPHSELLDKAVNNTMELLQNFVSTPSATEGEVNDSITTLVDRLSHSTLISDRRSAILSLKSYSRQYREIVIAKGLKFLVSNLSRDSMDNDVVKATLETLLILFIRGEGDEDVSRNWISEQARQKNGKYPSPTLLGNKVKADQFSLWIADEFTQSLDNIELLLDFLQIDDMHIRIYTLQLLQALCTTRAARTKELILKIPTAVSKLCSVLDETYEPIRNEAILLLMAIVKDNFNIQKLVVFENTFDKLYKIINEEGGVMGNIIVQDCMTLINNLLSYNSVNQKYFLETNCIIDLSRLIGQPLSSGQQQQIVWNPQRLQNMLTTLATCRLFVPEDTNDIKNAQDILDRSNIMLSALQLAFGLGMPTEIRVASLLMTADIIRGNNKIQAKFSMIDVPYLDPGLPNTAQKYEEPLPVLDALLNWCLYVNSVHLFDLRVATSTTLKAYFKNNDTAKATFLEEQVHIFSKMNGYSENNINDVNGIINAAQNTEIGKAGSITDKEEMIDSESKSKDGSVAKKNNNSLFTESPSDLSVDSASNKINSDSSQNSANDTQEDHRSEPLGSNNNEKNEEEEDIYRKEGNLIQELVFVDKEAELNPYKIWFSADLLIYLLHEFEKGKKLMMTVTIGNDDADEDLVNILDALGQALCLCLKFSDPRIPISYVMLMVCWSWEDYEAVDVCLSDASILDQLLSFLIDNAQENALIIGSISVFLGVLYEFSRGTSPIPRSKLYNILNNRIGSNSFSLKIQQFMLLPHVQAFDALSYSKERDDTGLPEVFFTPIFISLVKDNYNRIKGSFGRDPSIIPERKLNFESYERIQMEYNITSKELKELKRSSTEASRRHKEEKMKLDEQLQKISSQYEHSLKELNFIKESKEQLHKELENTKAEVSRLRALEDKLRTEMSDISSKLDDATDELYDYRSENSKITAKLKQVTEQKGKAEDGINKMNRALMDLTREKSKDSKKITELEQSLRNTREQVESLKNSSQTIISQKKDEMALLNTKVNALKSEQQTSITNYNALNKSLNDASARLKASDEKVRKLLSKIHQAASLIESLKEENDSLKEKVKTQTDLLSNHEEQNKTLKKKYDELSKRTESLQDELTSTFEEFSSLQESSAKETDTLNSEIESYKEEIASLKDKKIALEKKVEALNLRMNEEHESHTCLTSKLKADVKEKSTIVETIATKLKNIESKNSKLTKDIDIKNKENAKLVQMQSELENKIKDYADGKKQIEEKFQKSKNELQSKINEIQQQMTGKQQELETKLEEKTKTLSERESKLRDLEEKLEKYAAQSENGAEVITLKRQIEDLKSEKEADTSKLIMQIESNKKQLKKEQNSIAKSHDEWKKLDNIKGALVEKLKVRISAAQKRDKDKEEEITLLKKKCEDTLLEGTKSAKELQAQIDILKKSAESASMQAKSQEKKYKKLLSEKGKEIVDLKNELSNIKETLADGHKGTNDLQKELQELRQKPNANSSLFEKQLSDREETLNSYKEKLDEQSAKLKRALEKDKELEQLKEKISSTSNEFDESKLQMKELIKENESLKMIERKNKELEKSLKERMETVSKASKKMKILQKAKQELEESTGKELTELKSKVKLLEQNLKFSKEETAELLGKLKRTGSEDAKRIETLNKKLKQIGESYQTVKKDKAALENKASGEMEKFSKQAQQLTDKLTDKEKILLKMRSEIEQLHSELSELKHAHSAELSKLKQKLQQSETSTAAKEDEMKKLKDENISIREKFRVMASSRREEADKFSVLSKEMEELKRNNLTVTENLKNKIAAGNDLIEQSNSKLKDAEISKKVACNARSEVSKKLESTTGMLSEKERAYKKLLEEKQKANADLEDQARQLDILKSQIQEGNSRAKIEDDEKLKKIQKELETETNENKKIKEQVRELQAEIEKEKKKDKGPSQEDFDDMLMLLDSLDKKNQKMKKRLSELGEVIPSDNDDDDDDDDDEDGEEENDS